MVSFVPRNFSQLFCALNKALCVKDYQLSQLENKKGMHWPSLFWFGTAIMSLTSGIYQSIPSSVLLGLGFCCMGYSSIRLLPADFFTKKLSLSVMPETVYRKLDLIIQFAGFIFIVVGLVVSYIYT